MKTLKQRLKNLLDEYKGTPVANTAFYQKVYDLMEELDGKGV